MNWFFTHTPLLYLTQSLWRDEAFSVLLAQHSVVDIVKLTAGDFTPPLYYILLHLWMLVFGDSEVAVRILSFLFHIGTSVLGYYITVQFFSEKSRVRACLVSLFLFINPMLVYYAFEARMYSLLAFFTLFSLYFLLKKSWGWYTVTSILSLYTHPFAVFALLAQGLWFLVAHTKSEWPNYIKAGGISLLLFLPWLVILTHQIISLAETWYYPVDRTIIESALANIFLGYDGRPPDFWEWSKRISMILLIITVSALYYKKFRKNILLLLSVMLFPLILVLGISQITPIYVNRYLIYVTVAEVMLLIHGIMNIRSPLIKAGILCAGAAALLWFHLWFPAHVQKVAFRETFEKIEKSYQQGELIVSANPLSYFESRYYAPDEQAVYLYNPKDRTIPPYIGRVLIPQSRIIEQIPQQTNVYLIQDNGTYVFVQNN